MSLCRRHARIAESIGEECNLVRELGTIPPMEYPGPRDPSRFWGRTKKPLDKTERGSTQPGPIRRPIQEKGKSRRSTTRQYPTSGSEISSAQAENGRAGKGRRGPADSHAHQTPEQRGSMNRPPFLKGPLGQADTEPYDGPGTDRPASLPGVDDLPHALAVLAVHMEEGEPPDIKISVRTGVEHQASASVSLRIIRSLAQALKDVVDYLLRENSKVLEIRPSKPPADLVVVVEESRTTLYGNLQDPWLFFTALQSALDQFYTAEADPVEPQPSGRPEWAGGYA